MVGPISARERASFVRKAQAGVALLVGVSAALVAVRAGATLAGTAAAGAAGLGAGAAIAWYIVPSDPVPANRRSPDRDRDRDWGRDRDRDGTGSALADGSGDERPEGDRSNADLGRRDER